MKAPLACVCWLWGSLFDASYVNTLRSMLERHLKIPHVLYCVTDQPAGIDHRVRIVPMPTEFTDKFRCRRRMWQYSKERRAEFGPRMLCLDLDLVVTDDITSLVDRPDPLVMVRIGYANVLSGSFILQDTGVLHGAYARYKTAPREFLAETRLKNASDQAMLNLYLRGKPVGEWRESDGFAVYFGAGYERFEHLGVGPQRSSLPAGTKVVILGSADKHVMDERRFDWVRNHWR